MPWHLPRDHRISHSTHRHQGHQGQMEGGILLKRAMMDADRSVTDSLRHKEEARFEPGTEAGHVARKQGTQGQGRRPIRGGLGTMQAYGDQGTGGGIGGHESGRPMSLTAGGQNHGSGRKPGGMGVQVSGVGNLSARGPRYGHGGHGGLISSSAELPRGGGAVGGGVSPRVVSRLAQSPLMSSQLMLGGPHSSAARPNSRGIQHQTRSRIGTRPGSKHPLAQSQVSLVSPRGEALPVPPSVLDAPPELGALLLSRSPVELLLEREQQEMSAGVPPLTAGLRVSEWIYTEMGPRLPPEVKSLHWEQHRGTGNRA